MKLLYSFWIWHSSSLDLSLTINWCISAPDNIMDPSSWVDWTAEVIWFMAPTTLIHPMGWCKRTRQPSPLRRNSIGKCRSLKEDQVVPCWIRDDSCWFNRNSRCQVVWSENIVPSISWLTPFTPLKLPFKDTAKYQISEWLYSYIPLTSDYIPIVVGQILILSSSGPNSIKLLLNCCLLGYPLRDIS